MLITNSPTTSTIRAKTIYRCVSRRLVLVKPSHRAKLVARAADLPAAQSTEYVCRYSIATLQTPTPIYFNRNNCRLELDSDQVKRGITFTAIPEGRGKAIVVASVEDPELAQLITPGQKLLGISDPMRPEVWPLNERASLRYIRKLVERLFDQPTHSLSQKTIIHNINGGAGDAIRMRRAETITLVFSPDAIPNFSLPTDVIPLTSSVSSSFEEEESVSDSDTDVGSSSSKTIAEQLQESYNQNASNTAIADFEKRIKRRKERMELVSERNDLPFFMGLAALFVMPALVILIYAQSSGYLDSLASNQRF